MEISRLREKLAAGDEYEHLQAIHKEVQAFLMSTLGKRVSKQGQDTTLRSYLGSGYDQDSTSPKPGQLKTDINFALKLAEHVAGK